MHQLLIDDELKRAGVRRPMNPIGIGWAGPTILHAGTAEQHERYLPGLLSGQDLWCQLFSEPGAGSDLASLATRAVRDGDEYVINGQKVWNSMAHWSTYGILIARTDPDAPKHQGISYFVCPMDLPGIEVRPLIEMTGVHLFNEVFFTDVRLPAENLIGHENRGWELAKVTLGNERVSLSGEGALWGSGPTVHDLLAHAKTSGATDDPLVRQRITRLYIEGEILRLIRLRTVTAALKGRPPGPEASIRKALADDHGQRLMDLAKDLAGADGMLAASPTAAEGADAAAASMLGGGDVWSHGFLFAPALTIGGGTSEVQRNIIGERVLGLPHDIDIETRKSWAEAHSN
jgi:alkylation response protein AidB-like acyl-CoA dehydrogenase